MKYLYTLLFIAFILISNVSMAQHRKINCDSLCVTNIELSNDTLNVTLYNGDSAHINYPLIKVIYNGDTVANQTEFNFFAHMGKRSQVHQVKTTLTSIPGNFACKVVVIDPLWKDTCIIDYPCTKGQHNSIKNAFVSGSFKLYPNPAKNRLTIQIDYAGTQNNLYVKIISGNGTVISLNTISSLNNYMMDISNLPAGIYFVQFISRDKVFVQKFVKE